MNRETKHPYRLTLPGKTVIGENALGGCRADIAALGRKAFVVTGKVVRGSGAVKTLTDYLGAWGLACEVFDGIAGEPTTDMVAAGVEAFHDAGCDFVIGIGGGSPLDSAKAIAAMTALPGELTDYAGSELEGKFPPTVLIPTTAGTGSEATKFTVITDSARGVKMLLKGEALLPALAVIDPTFALTAPPNVTAATGMDALTHAVEAYTSRKAMPLTDILALDAIKRIFRSLPTAYRDGSDIKARESLAIAAYEAGVCINNSSVTLVHGMSRPIGALFHVPHGISNAMLIKPCLEYALDGCFDRFAAISSAIGAASWCSDSKESAHAFIRELNWLCRELEIPTLAQYGVERGKFDGAVNKMAHDAWASGSPANTIKEVGRDDMAAIYRSLWM